MQENAPCLIDLRADLPRHKTRRWRTRPVEAIDCVVTHQSIGSAKSASPGTLTRNMAAYHVNNDPRGIAYGRNWPGLAYHFCIEPDGTTVWANDFEAVTYHTGGRRNRDGIGIVVCGDFDGPGHKGRHVPTPEQEKAWFRLAQWLQAEFGIDVAKFYGHCDAPGGTMKAACPGYVVFGWIEQFRGRE